tara:strand:+ start:188 stop:406 length:219 start_codon:yes stop_codon:yes gene_type:complete
MPKKYYKAKPKVVAKQKKKPLQKVQKKDTVQTDKCMGKNCYSQSDNLKVMESISKEKKIKESDIFDMAEKKK